MLMTCSRLVTGSTSIQLQRRRTKGCQCWMDMVSLRMIRTDYTCTPSVEYSPVSSSAALMDEEDDVSVISQATSSEGYQPSSGNSFDTVDEASPPPLLSSEVQTVTLSGACLLTRIEVIDVPDTVVLRSWYDQHAFN